MECEARAETANKFTQYQNADLTNPRPRRVVPTVYQRPAQYRRYADETKNIAVITIVDKPPTQQNETIDRIKATTLTATDNKPRAQWKRWADRNNPIPTKKKDEYPRAQWKRCPHPNTGVPTVTIHNNPPNAKKEGYGKRNETVTAPTTLGTIQAQWKTLIDRDVNNNLPLEETQIPTTTTPTIILTSDESVGKVKPLPELPRLRPTVRSVIKVSIPLEKLTTPQKRIADAKRALQDVEKRIQDVDLEMRVNKAAIENMTSEMQIMDTQIATCPTIRRDMPILREDDGDLKDDDAAPCTSGTPNPLANQTAQNQEERVEWERNDILNLTDDTVKSWMPLDGWET